jgi:hypothetical protein
MTEWLRERQAQKRLGKSVAMTIRWAKLQTGLFGANLDKEPNPRPKGLHDE